MSARERRGACPYRPSTARDVHGVGRVRDAIPGSSPVRLRAGEELDLEEARP